MIPGHRCIIYIEIISNIEGLLGKTGHYLLIVYEACERAIDYFAHAKISEYMMVSSASQCFIITCFINSKQPWNFRPLWYSNIESMCA